MNDEFLQSLRRDPPPRFARRLKRQLQSQEARRSWSLRTLLFVIAGSAFAAGMFFFEKQSDEQPQVAQSHTEVATATSTISALPAAPKAPTQIPAAAAPSPADPTPSTEPIHSRPVANIATSPLTDALVRSFLASRQRPQSDAPRIQTLEPDAAFTALCAPGKDRQLDLIVTSRRISHAEFMNCRDNGVGRMIELKLGYQALVLASARHSAPVQLSVGDVYLAVAKQIPDAADLSRSIANTNFTWDQVNNKLAYRPIAVFGPMRDTPLRLLFETLLLEPGCNAQRTSEAPQFTAPEHHAELCHAVRDDRLYAEVEQTANLIPQSLWADPHGFVLVDYPFYLENKSQLSASAMAGPEPSLATFADGTYPLARPIYLYADDTRIGRIADVFEPLQSLQRFGLWVPNRFGFVRLDEQETPRHWRLKPPLTASDLVPQRSVP